MKKLLLVLIFVVFVAGCDTTESQRLEYARNAVTKLQMISDNLTAAESTVDSALAAAKGQMANLDILSDEQKASLTEKIESLQEQYASVKEYKVKVDAELMVLNKALEEAVAGTSSELEVVGTTVGSVAKYLPTPVGEIVTVVSTLLISIGAYKKRKQYLETSAPKDEAFKYDVVNALENARSVLSEPELKKFDAELERSLPLKTYNEYDTLVNP